MTKASPDTNQPNEILSYGLLWETGTRAGVVKVVTRAGSAQDLPVKSLADLAALADILRKEKPVFLDRGGKDFRIRTGEEPAGEEDHG